MLEGTAENWGEDVTEERSENLSNPLQGSSSRSPVMVAAEDEIVAVVIELGQEGTVGQEDGPLDTMALETRKLPVPMSAEEAPGGDVPEPDKNSCSIDDQNNKSFGVNYDSDKEKCCRICHLSSETPLEASDLIQLGCSCKGALGISHHHCAMVWFKQKGNNQCEICGEPAKNMMATRERIFGIEGQLRFPTPSPSGVSFWGGSTPRNQIWPDYPNDGRRIGERSPRDDFDPWMQSSCNICKFLGPFLLLAITFLWYFSSRV